MVVKKLENGGRGQWQWLRAVAVCMTVIMLGLGANAETIRYGGREYKNAKVVPSKEFLSVIHEGGIKRIPWDKAPTSLKVRFPRPGGGEDAKEDTVTADEVFEEEKTSRRRGGVFGRRAPSLEDLTKRYRSDMDYAKRAWENEGDSTKKRKKELEYDEAKRRYDLAVSHYDKMLARSGNDLREAADMWQATISDVMAGRRAEAKKERAAADAVVDYDFKGKVTMAFYGKQYSKTKMQSAMAKGRNADGGWGGWKLWSTGGRGLSRGSVIWIENIGSIPESNILAHRKGGASQLTLTVVLKKAGTANLLGSAGKQVRVPKYDLVLPK